MFFQEGRENLYILLKNKSKDIFLFIFLALITGAFIYIFNKTSLTKKLASEAVLSSSEAPKPVSSLDTHLGNSDPLNTGTVIVDISGAVISPGIYEASSGARVGDLLKMAGGLSSLADKKYIEKNINLSQKLQDEDKIYFPYLSDLTSSSQNVCVESLQTSTVVEETKSESSLNINKSSLKELDDLPGIGPTYAQKIIDTRPYKDFNDFSIKSKIPKATLEKIKNLINFN